MSETLTVKTVKSSFWSILDIFFRQGFGFIISIILARLLLPSDYGTIGILMIFITISNVFVDSGFASGLIRKIDRTQEDLSTAFYFNIAVAAIVYFVLFTIAPFIASSFHNNELTLYLRIIGIVIIINSFNLVQNAILISSLRTKEITMVSVLSQSLTGVIAIYLAFTNYGIWALVFQQICSSFLQFLLLTFITKWRPSFIFSRESFRYLWKYGSKLLTANLIGTAFSQAYAFFIGKMIGKHELGLYSRADQFAVQPESVINNIINKSLMPSLATCQNNIDRLRRNYIKCVEIISFIIFPMMFTLGIASKPLFNVLFGTKWNEAIPLFEILCFGYAFDIFSLISLNVIQVLGRTDYTLKLEILKKPIYAVIIIISVYGGLTYIVYGKALYCVIAAAANMSVVKFLLKYSYLKQVTDILKYALISILILIPSFHLINLYVDNNLLILFIFSLLGNTTYVFVCFILRLSAIDNIKSILIHK